MPSTNSVPPPAAFRPQNNGLSTLLWIAGLVLAAFGVMFAVVDVSNGTATAGAADGSFRGPLPAEEPVLVGAPLAPAPAITAAPPSREDALARAAARAAREREADVLIEGLQRRLRAEREARQAARRRTK